MGDGGPRVARGRTRPGVVRLPFVEMWAVVVAIDDSFLSYGSRG